MLVPTGACHVKSGRVGGAGTGYLTSCNQLTWKDIRMPKDTKEELPGTIQRSPAKARRTFAKTLESAHEQYDSEERAHRTAFASLKRGFKKVGDHWEPKKKKKN